MQPIVYAQVSLRLGGVELAEMMRIGSIQQGAIPRAHQAQKMQQTSHPAAATSAQPGAMVWICALLQLEEFVVVEVSLMFPKMQAPLAKLIWDPSPPSCLPHDLRCVQAKERLSPATALMHSLCSPHVLCTGLRTCLTCIALAIKSRQCLSVPEQVICMLDDKLLYMAS